MHSCRKARCRHWFLTNNRFGEYRGSVEPFSMDTSTFIWSAICSNRNKCILKAVSSTTTTWLQTLSKKINIFRSSSSLSMASFLYGLHRTGEQSSMIVRCLVTYIWIPSVHGWCCASDFFVAVSKTSVRPLSRLFIRSAPASPMSSINKLAMYDLPVCCAPTTPITKKSVFVSINRSCTLFWIW